MGKYINLQNQRFGFWLVLNAAEKKDNGQTQWICQCDCGNVRTLTTNSLRTGNSTSCGCNHNPNLMGEKFGKLTVISIDIVKSQKIRRFWLCKCKCNKEISASTYQLRNNLIDSCRNCINEYRISDKKGSDLVINNIKLIYECKNSANKLMKTIDDLQKEYKKSGIFISQIKEILSNG